MRKVFGYLFVLAGIASATYYGYVVLVQGITMIIEGAKSVPTDFGEILLGLVLFPAATIVGLFLLGFFTLFGITLLESRTDTASKSMFNQH